LRKKEGLEHTSLSRDNGFLAEDGGYSKLVSTSLAFEKIAHLEYIRGVRIIQFENYGSSLSVIRASAGHHHGVNGWKQEEK
jgi:hypothetical protein